MKKLRAIAAIALLLGLSGCLSTVHPIFTEKDLVFDPKLIGTWNYTDRLSKDEVNIDSLEKNPPRQQDIPNVSGSILKVDQNNTTASVDATTDGTVEITQATSSDFNDAPQLKKLIGKTYLIRRRNSDGHLEAVYFGFLVKLGNNYYMDYYPAETPATKLYDHFYKSHCIRMHTAYRIRFNGNNGFELKQLDESFLQKLIENKKIRIRHEIREDGTFIVTAPTEELQQYLLKYGNVPEAYYEDNTSTYSRIPKR